MRYYPVFMDVTDKTCLVVGGGSVGTRKALGLLKAGARVKVVSPAMTDPLLAAACESPMLELVVRPFEPGDMNGVSLVFAATDHQALNARVRTAAAEAGVLCNAADGEDKGDFILPSVVSRGDLLLAVSTCGASPALAKAIRKRLEQSFGPEYETLTRLLARVRQRLLEQGHDPAGHKQVLTTLVEQDLAPLLAVRDHAAVDQILFQVLGQGFSWDSLGIEEP